jgi:hypothetical protein
VNRNGDRIADYKYKVYTDFLGREIKSLADTFTKEKALIT